MRPCGPRSLRREGQPGQAERRFPVQAGALTRSTAWSDPVDNVRDKVVKSPEDNAKTCTPGV